MKQVKIAEFKTHLSAHLKKVRKGEEIVILDREQPIAKVIPFPGKEDELCIVQKPKIKGGLKKLRFRGIKERIDVVKLLREDRDRR
jgi:antitoxin (DNA-binding transcriptional repressor) of toxin-antitoxin stability system